MNKAERLIIAGDLAPKLRDQKPRKVTTIGPDGKPRRIVTSIDVAEGVLARAQIEFAITESMRKAFCKNFPECKVKIRKSATGFCVACFNRTRKVLRPQQTCKDCGALLKNSRRLAKSERCLPCSGRFRMRSFTPEQRRAVAIEAGKRGARALSTEQRRRGALLANAVRSATERSETAKAAAMKRDHVKRSEGAKNAAARRSPLMRSDIARRAALARWGKAKP